MQDVVDLGREAVTSLEAVLADATAALRGRLVVEGHVLARLVEKHQRGMLGLGWLASYVDVVRHMTDFAARSSGEAETLITRIALGEIVTQIASGIPLSQSEIVRPEDLGTTGAAITKRFVPAVRELAETGNTADNRVRLGELVIGGSEAQAGFDDMLDSVRDEMRKFAVVEISPHAHGWQGGIPAEVIARMAASGVFGLCIPEQFGGMGIGKQTMCVVSEEFSRGILGAGAMVGRADFAADLLMTFGTMDQKERWLPRIAAAEAIPAIAFEEAQGDLAAIKTKAARSGGNYKIQGRKSWVADGADADVLLLLARTGDGGERGLSLFFAQKPRGNAADPFPGKGISGRKLETFGRTAVADYEIAFDGFEVPAADLLGGAEGLGVMQITQAMETARIQTAARAVGLAQAAMDQSIAHLQQRARAGIAAGPRIAERIATVATEIMTARQVTYASAREKDTGRNPFLTSAAAQLLAVRAAVSAADNAMQIYGADAFAAGLPVTRISGDARHMTLSGGTPDILAQGIARRLLGN